MFHRCGSVAARISYSSPAGRTGSRTWPSESPLGSRLCCIGCADMLAQSATAQAIEFAAGLNGNSADAEASSGVVARVVIAS